MAKKKIKVENAKPCKYCGKPVLHGRCVCYDCQCKLPAVKKLMKQFEMIKSTAGEVKQ